MVSPAGGLAISIDPERALQELAFEMFPNALAVGRELVQNALDSIIEKYGTHASEKGSIDIKIDAEEVVIQDNGTGLTQRDIENELLLLGNVHKKAGKEMRDAREIALSYVGGFGVGFTSTKRLKPSSIRVESYKDGKSIEYLDTNGALGHSAVYKESSFSEQGTRITVKRKNVNYQREIDFIRNYCELAEVPITINGERINKTAEELFDVHKDGRRKVIFSYGFSDRDGKGTFLLRNNTHRDLFRNHDRLGPIYEGSHLVLHNNGIRFKLDGHTIEDLFDSKDGLDLVRSVPILSALNHRDVRTDLSRTDANIAQAKKVKVAEYVREKIDEMFVAFGDFVKENPEFIPHAQAYLLSGVSIPTLENEAIFEVAHYSKDKISFNELKSLAEQGIINLYDYPSFMPTLVMREPTVYFHRSIVDDSDLAGRLRQLGLHSGYRCSGKAGEHLAKASKGTFRTGLAAGSVWLGSAIFSYLYSTFSKDPEAVQKSASRVEYTQRVIAETASQVVEPSAADQTHFLLTSGAVTAEIIGGAALLSYVAYRLRRSHVRKCENKLDDLYDLVGGESERGPVSRLMQTEEKHGPSRYKKYKVVKKFQGCLSTNCLEDSLREAYNGFGKYVSDSGTSWISGIDRMGVHFYETENISSRKPLLSTIHAFSPELKVMDVALRVNCNHPQYSSFVDKLEARDYSELFQMVSLACGSRNLREHYLGVLKRQVATHISE
ncbi:hypothetical protein HN698_03080 [Candidatus Woesearchaeota archaeon]|nr:hypothetical protein [Candidatus Woesearchaeota archaeon]MBT7930873.1 hypothetical protein [Candidatus Woesearchaeota archaeon]